MTKSVVSEYKNVPVLSLEAKKIVYGDSSGAIPENIKQELEEYVRLADIRDQSSMEEMVKHFDEVFKNGPL